MNIKRLLRIVGATLGLSAVFVAATVTALVLHLDLPRGRRFLSQAIASALDHTLQGSFVVSGIERVSVDGLVLLGVEVRDPEHRVVLTATRIRVESLLLVAVWRLLSESEKVTLDVERVEIARAEAHWYGDANGVPSIARAFTPRPSKSAPSAPGESREVRVAVRAVELAHGFARGAPFGLPTLEAEVSQVRGFVLVTPLGAEVALGRSGVVIRGLGGADLRGVSSLRLRTPGYVFTSFDGHFGDVQVGAVVRTDGDHLTGTLDLPGVRAEQLRAVAPGLPFVSPIDAHIEVEGILPRLRTSARLRIGENARALIAGPLELARESHALLEVVAEDLDLRAFSPKLPLSKLDAKAVVKVTAGTNLLLEGDITTKPGMLGGVKVPSAEISASLRGGLLTGRAHLNEPGLPLNATFALRPDGSADLSAETPALELHNPRLRPVLDAQGRGNARLVAHLDQGKLTVEANADVTRFSRGDLSAGRVKVHARGRGHIDALDALSIDGKFDAEQAKGPQLSLSKVTGTVSGPISAPLVTASARDEHGATIDAKARVRRVDDGARVERLGFIIKREQAEIEGSAEQLDLTGGRVRLSGVALKGAGGTLNGSLELTDTLFALEARGEKLNFGKLLRMLGLPSHVVGGELDFDADVLVARDIERGTVNATWRDGTLGPLSDVTSSLHARLENRRLQGDFSGDLKGILRAAGRFTIDVPGSVREPKALKDSVGDVELDVQDVDLTLLGRALAPGRDPLVSGKLTFLVKAARRTPYVLPSLALSGYSDGFELDTKSLLGSKERLTGVDARFGANVSGETGASDLSLKLVDKRGSLATASVATTIDLVQLLAKPSEFYEQLLATELGGKLLLDERSFEELPSALKPDGVTGRLRAELAMNGTLSTPSLAGRVRLARVEWVDSGTVPLDLCSTLGFEPTSHRLGSRGEVFLARAGGAGCDGQRIGQYSLTTTLAPRERGLLPLEGSAVATLERAPLGTFPLLAELGVGGHTTGSVSLSMNDGPPALVANLTLNDATVHDVPIGDGRLELRSNEKVLGLSLDLAKDNGRIQATAFAALDYSEPLPRLDPNEPIGVRVTAERADAVVLSPFTRDLFSEIGGQVDAKLTLSLRRQTSPNGATTTSGNVEGNFALHQGTLELADLGLRLFETELSATASSEGQETRVDFAEINAKAGKGKQSLRIKNGKLWLKGLELSRAEGSLDATELPLGIQGMPLATATTRQSVTFELEHRADAMRARIDVPYMVVALPQSSTRALISLDENRSIEIVQPLGASRKKSAESLPWQFEFVLGKNVKLTRSDLDLPLSGRALLTLGQEFAVSGDVELTPGGRVDISGRTFVVESGEVHFDNGEPSNPRLRVTATWRLADGGVVTAELKGTLQKATLSLESPGKTQREIQALLLGTGGGVGDAQATGVGVGADQLLGPLLENTPLRRVALRTGSEQTADQRRYATYSAAWPISENLWFEGSYKSLTNGSKSQDMGATSAWSGTVDWRFRKNWSLRSEVGTIGAGLDLVWNHRY